jgi:hypothetical protein
VRRLIEDRGPVGLGGASVDTTPESQSRPAAKRASAGPGIHRK